MCMNRGLQISKFDPIIPPAIHSSHYNDVIMSAIASQITSLTIVYSTVYSDADQRKHKSSASLAFVWGIHRDRWIPCTKGQLRDKCLHLMTSSCYQRILFLPMRSFCRKLKNLFHPWLRYNLGIIANVHEFWDSFDDPFISRVDVNWF